jgi:hypothetical protein
VFFSKVRRFLRKLRRVAAHAAILAGRVVSRHHRRMRTDPAYRARVATALRSVGHVVGMMPRVGAAAAATVRMVAAVHTRCYDTVILAGGSLE